MHGSGRTLLSSIVSVQLNAYSGGSVYLLSQFLGLLCVQTHDPNTTTLLRCVRLDTTLNH
jgi:hypothetical protein